MGEAARDRLPGRADPEAGTRYGPVLDVRRLSVSFGGLRALNGVDLEVPEGEVLAVIGPNGAGKTTLFDVVTGLTEPDRGRIFLEGRDVTGDPAWRRAAGGLGRTFQNLRLFEGLTVFQNVLAARQARRASRGLAYVLGLPGALAEERAARERALEELRFVDLVGRRDERVGSLPYGHRRRVEIARALATGASVVLLDEPAAGMNPRESRALVELIGRIRERGVTVVLVEHHMRVVMAVSDRVTVLHQGAVISEGTPHEVQADEAVVEAYLGPGRGHAGAR